MVNVRNRVAAIEQRQNAMSDDLKRFLDLAWSHRKDNVNNTYSAGNLDAYGLYIRAQQTPGFGSADLIQFLQGVMAMPQLPEIQCVPDDPNDALGDYLRRRCNATSALSGFAALNHLGYQKLLARAQANDSLCKALSRTFYHFRRNRHKSSDRIYLHTKPREALRVISHIVQHMLLQPLAHPGISNAKTAAPSRESRHDTIVIYLNDTAALNLALDEIARYQQNGNRQRFSHGTSRMTKHITEHNGVELVGVGTGAEPPVGLYRRGNDLLPVPGGSSFGSFRSKLIEYAMENTLDAHEGKPQFINRVANYFRAAGIDPTAPHSHSNAPELSYRARKTVEQLRNGVEPSFKIA